MILGSILVMSLRYATLDRYSASSVVASYVGPDWCEAVGLLDGLIAGILDSYGAFVRRLAKSCCGLWAVDYWFFFLIPVCLGDGVGTWDMIAFPTEYASLFPAQQHTALTLAYCLGP